MESRVDTGKYGYIWNWRGTENLEAHKKSGQWKLGSLWELEGHWDLGNYSNAENYVDMLKETPNTWERLQ